MTQARYSPAADTYPPTMPSASRITSNKAITRGDTPGETHHPSPTQMYDDLSTLPVQRRRPFGGNLERRCPFVPNFAIMPACDWVADVK